jgi:hypothetical protein
MSYHCPKCRGVIYDRTNYICPACGNSLPPELLFRPPDMPDYDAVIKGKEVQVALLSHTLYELRKAHGQPQALREVTIHYFRTGLSHGFEIGQLLEWLFFWPNNRWSAFAQANFSSKGGHEYIEMVKSLTVRDFSDAPKNN